jgi:hypothetical protein
MGDRNDVVMRFEGRFDEGVARAARVLLRGLPSGSGVAFEFHRARVDAVSLAVLGVGVRDLHAGRVVFGGLDRHHARTLRYLGLALDAERDAPGAAGP